MGALLYSENVTNTSRAVVYFQNEISTVSEGCVFSEGLQGSMGKSLYRSYDVPVLVLSVRTSRGPFPNNMGISEVFIGASCIALGKVPNGPANADGMCQRLKKNLRCFYSPRLKSQYHKDLEFLGVIDALINQTVPNYSLQLSPDVPRKPGRPQYLQIIRP